MRILALDIGAGTEDVLLYDDAKRSVENCMKMVLPSPSQVFAAKVRQATHRGQDLFIEGDIIGGGVFSSAVRAHVAAGLRVVMTAGAAYTIRNDLDDIKGEGIEITDRPRPRAFKGETIVLEEVNLTRLEAFLNGFNETLHNLDLVAVAVQDHGRSSKGTSNRRSRIQKMKELLEAKPEPQALAFRSEEIPCCFMRMKSAAVAVRRQLPQVEALVMDTAPAAILGCMVDPAIGEDDPILAINVGNGHTMVATIHRGKIAGLLEHHTKALDPQSIEKLVVGFADGILTNEQVFEDGGHGLLQIEEPLGYANVETIAATGPNRNILAESNLSVHYAAPGGDMMMTGPMGLVEAAKRRLSSLKGS